VAGSASEAEGGCAQPVAPAAPPVLWPAGHAVQALEPAAALKVPEEHSVQEAAPPAA